MWFLPLWTRQGHKKEKPQGENGKTKAMSGGIADTHRHRTEISAKSNLWHAPQGHWQDPTGTLRSNGYAQFIAVCSGDKSVVNITQRAYKFL
jgi:hypothetical protein